MAAELVHMARPRPRRQGPFARQSLKPYLQSGVTARVISFKQPAPTARGVFP